MKRVALTVILLALALVPACGRAEAPSSEPCGAPFAIEGAEHLAFLRCIHPAPLRGAFHVEWLAAAETTLVARFDGWVEGEALGRDGPVLLWVDRAGATIAQTAVPKEVVRHVTREGRALLFVAKSAEQWRALLVDPEGKLVHEEELPAGAVGAVSPLGGAAPGFVALVRPAREKGDSGFVVRFGEDGTVRARTPHHFLQDQVAGSDLAVDARGDVFVRTATTAAEGLSTIRYDANGVATPLASPEFGGIADARDGFVVLPWSTKACPPQQIWSQRIASVDAQGQPRASRCFDKSFAADVAQHVIGSPRGITWVAIARTETDGPSTIEVLALNEHFEPTRRVQLRIDGFVYPLKRATFDNGDLALAFELVPGIPRNETERRMVLLRVRAPR